MPADRIDEHSSQDANRESTTVSRAEQGSGKINVERATPASLPHVRRAERPSSRAAGPVDRARPGDHDAREERSERQPEAALPAVRRRDASSGRPAPDDPLSAEVSRPAPERDEARERVDRRRVKATPEAPEGRQHDSTTPRGSDAPDEQSATGDADTGVEEQPDSREPARPYPGVGPESARPDSTETAADVPAEVVREASAPESGEGRARRSAPQALRDVVQRVPDALRSAPTTARDGVKKVADSAPEKWPDWAASALPPVINHYFPGTIPPGETYMKEGLATHFRMAKPLYEARVSSLLDKIRRAR